MIILAFFFLLRPGEYTATKSNSTPFRLCDVTLSVGRMVFSLDSSETDLLSATFAILTFTTQKNGVQGEKIGQVASRDPLLCPKDALVCRVLHLKKEGADPTTPISKFKASNGRWKSIIPSLITATLKVAVNIGGGT